jgi:hypothetical protein
MAAKTPDKVYQDKLGSLRLVRAVFSTTNLDDADTYASGIDAVVDYWFSPKIDPSTNSSAGINITHSSGTFTFYPGVDNMEGTLFILVRG